jgi:putative ubiquitin-RnfH superfamily antitoxin RatB of RatAB toxin-antitoxin module
MKNAGSDPIAVQVVYALPRRQCAIKLQLPQDATIAQAIERSGILAQFPQIDLTTSTVGVFGRLATLETMLREGDRVEIYRGLLADPKVVRRERVAKKRKLLARG